MKKSEQSQKNLLKALTMLEKAVSTPPVEERDYAGIIQSFEFTYELTWKTLKAILDENGIAAPFPRVVFEESYKRGLLEGNEIWKDIIEARNLSTHTYDETLAHQLCADIQSNYLQIFKRTTEKISNFVLNPQQLP